MNIKGKELIALGIGIAFMVAIIPASIEDISSVDTSNWTPAAQSMWNLLPLIIVGVIVMAIAGGLYAKKKGMI